MNSMKQAASSGDPNEEIPALIETLLAAEQRLEELTAGGVDTAAGRDGRAFMLRRAQEQSRQAGKALRESEQEFRSLAESMPQLVWKCRSDGWNVYFNQRWVDYTGLTLEASYGRGWFEPFHPDDRQRALDAWRDAVENGAEYNPECRLRDRHGAYRWFLIRGVPQRNEAGAIIWWFGTCTDIDEQKQAGEVLRASEKKFHQLADNITDAFWMRSPDMKTVHYVSAGFELIWGRSRERWYANPDEWREAIFPEDRELVRGVFATLMGDAPQVSVEYRITRPDGAIRWVHARGFQVRDDAGNLVRLTGIVTDITERLRSQELMRLQEAALRSAANVVVITDRAGLIVWTNPAFTKVTGYTAAEVLGKNPRVLQSSERPSSYPATYYQDLWKTISSGAVWQGEFRNGRKDGTPLIEEATITPVRDEKGEITHFVAVKQDITARKRAEAALEKAHRELLEVSRQAGMAEVATSVLHNVGNVLNSVNVSATLFDEQVKNSKVANLVKVVALMDEHAADLGAFITDDPKGKLLPGYLKQLTSHLAAEQATLLKESDHLRKNIEHIKDIVAMQQSYARVSGVTETLKINDLVEDALRMNAVALMRHEVEVVREFAEIPPITIDKHKVLQVLVNLIDNANYACDESGRTDKRMTVRVANSEGRVTIAIIDNGVGIPAENLNRIFNHGFTTRKDGHGFGLHIAALAAKELGGALRVHSDGVGQGATFTLELHVEQEKHAP